MVDKSLEKFIDVEVNERFTHLEKYIGYKHPTYRQKLHAIWSAESYLFGIGKALAFCGELEASESGYAVDKLRKLLKYDDFWHEYGILNESEQ